jgi:hypothetical protein
VTPANLIIAYTTAGILLIAVQLIRQRFRSDSKKPDLIIDEKGILGFVGRYVIPVLVVTAVIAAWPVFLMILLKKRKPIPRDPAELEFRVSAEDLGAEISIEEIEASEIVKDPLGAAPEIPFGHLNAVWVAFKARLNPEDSIYRFNSDWTDAWGYSRHLAGYVAVNDGKPGEYLTTLRIGIKNKDL